MHPRPGRKFYWLVIVSWILAGGFLILVRQAGAQAPGGLNVGIQPFLPQTGLSAPDIREVIASLIKIFLGFLGVIALGLILYGGFLWMTSGGNAEKVTTAKNLIRNAVIGLIIILSAYAIVSFIFIQLEQATGIRPGGGGRGGGGGVGGGLPPGAFVVKGISPQGKIGIRNVVVRLTFSRNPDPKSVSAGNVKIQLAADQSAVAGKFNTSGQSVEFVPDAACPAPNGTLKCFGANAEYVVEVSTSLRSLDGKDLICGIGGSSCRAVFITGAAVDTAPPQITLTSPADGDSVSTDSQIALEANATDDSGISQVVYLVDGKEVDVDSPTSDVSPLNYKSVGSWDTKGLLPGSSHTIKAVAHDLNDNRTDSNEASVLVRAAHCFNKIQDEDETSIDCGGKSCGACTGQVCKQNSDCSSGVCIGGRCLELPIITDIDPKNGAPGNFITIKGSHFGVNEGRVTFLGKVNNSNDDVTASLASCKGAWHDDQVIIEVPVGASSGPLKLTTADNLYDQTNDARGYRGDFEVNNTVRPGLCSINPSEGEEGISVALQGQGFGSTPDTVVFGGAKASKIGTWADKAITGAVVPGVNPGKVDVAVAVKNEKSNAVQFNALKSTSRPVIDSVNPVSGPPGQYLTIKGSGFGASSGTVKFISVAAGTETLADVSFPDYCGKDYWHDDYIIVKVPGADTGSYKIKVVRDNKESNAVDFSINKAQLTPGVCKVSPDNGPVSTTVDVLGERFGTAQGKMRFFNLQENGRISSWTDTDVRVDVPALAKTGPLALVNSTGTLSNQLVFTVGECAAGSCRTGDECCSNGSCQAAGTCVSTKAICTYSWLFSTGDLGIIDPSLIPSVVDDPSCHDGNPQSPTPYKNTTDACVNAQVSARFNKKMRDATLNTSNILLYKCDSSADFNSGSCQTKIDGVIKLLGRDTDTEGFLFKPSVQFSTDTWYQVTIKKDVQSSKGINMLEDYVWHFKSSIDAGACQVDQVQIVPWDAIIQELNGTMDYSGLPTAANCNILDPDSYAWNWVSSDPTRAKVQQTIKSTTVATALAETEPSQPVHVAGAIPSQSKGGFGKLTIDFGNPRVIKNWPSCVQACINGKIGAQFNIKMNPATLNAATVKLYTCDPSDATCNKLNPVPLASINYDPVNFVVDMVPVGGLLQPNTDYRGVIIGGTNGVESTSNTTLVGLNYATKPGAADSYSWLFRTQNSKEVCAVDRVEVYPPKIDIFLIAYDQPYSSYPFSAPDACDPNGEALNAYFYSWSWLATTVKDNDEPGFPWQLSQVASVTNNDVLPKDHPDGLIDPLQTATTLGPGKAKIQAGTQGKAGEGELNVICGFRADADCPLPATIQTYGVGNDTCCRPRPAVTQTLPPDGATNVCRNSLVILTFNQQMDNSTLTDNVFIEGNFGSSPCPEIDGVSSQIELSQNPDGSTTKTNWCRWPVQVVPYLFKNTTLVNVELKQLMEPNHQYRVKVRGDPDVTDAQKEGVLSAWGVPMNGDFSAGFGVGSDICKVEAVDIQVFPPGQTIQRDLFTCAGRDDCPGDQSVNPGNQHAYFALARDGRGNPLPADYTWAIDGSSLSLDKSTGQQVLLTPQPTNGPVNVTVYAKGRGLASGDASRTQSVFIFICQNPWPSLSDFPYTDSTTNFSLFYCRDSGQQGVADLPPLIPSAVTPGTGNVIKQFLFIIK